ncbi:MAG: hypothetical protein P4L86_09185 [Mycobacterium sp.]|nr:hypothetical protein [Mycobacterium sp.]
MRTQAGLSRYKSGRYRLAILAAAVGIAAATSQNVAWAEPVSGDSSGSSGSSSSQSGPAHAGATGTKVPADITKTHQNDTSSTKTNDDKSKQTDSNKTDQSKSKQQPTGTTKTGTAASPTGGTAPATSTTETTDNPADAKPTTTPLSIKPTKSAVTQSGSGAPTPKPATAVNPAPATAVGTSTPAAAKPATATPGPTAPAIRTAALAVTTNNTPTTTTTPVPPQPLSPIAQIIQLPGRIINTVLQVLDLTVSASGPQSPFNWSPVSEALFAAFRGIEDFLGLSKTPTSVPVVPTLTYTGPTTGNTPTVSQFLDAAAGEYVLGGQPGGLQPFTVNGFQLQTFNPLSGAVGKAWVTPTGQVIIAYQGTTGGTNLLFHPLIAISQIFADMQLIFTNTTPQAFWDSLAFEKQVETAAVAQGYSTNDIFVTGHSLGDWEAQFVAQQTGLGGIGFEGPGLNTSVPGNGVNSNFVNVETYGDTAAYLATDLPGLQPFMPPFVPGGGSKPHYGDIVMIGDPNAVNPLFNASALWGPNPINDIVFAVDVLGNFLEHHLPGMQAYNLGVSPDPGVVPWLGAYMGAVNTWSDLTIPELQQAASDAGVLIAP